MATVTSKQFSLNARDFVRGAILAIITPVLAIITNSLDKGELTFNWKLIGVTAISAFIGYLVKNYFTPTRIEVKPVSDIQAQAVKDGEAEVVVQTK